MEQKNRVIHTIKKKEARNVMFENHICQNENGMIPGTCSGLIHVVEKGDTLYRLSRYYHVSVSDIMYENPYVNIYNLQVGDELCIPVNRKTETRRP